MSFVSGFQEREINILRDRRGNQPRTETVEVITDDKKGNISP